MSASFNLVDREWLPCITATGKVVPSSLLETLSRAHEFKELRDESPLVTIALHRLLLAVLHRVFGPATPTVWGQLWQNGAGQFDRVKLEDYLKSAAIFPRFDLFDPTHPFYQTAALPLGEPDGKNMGRPKFVKPIWQMAHELAYSDSMNLFAHYSATAWETRPAAQVARWLVAFQSFALAGLITTEEGKKQQDGSADAGHLVKSAVVLAKGDNLFQTLTLNLHHYSPKEKDGMPFEFNSSEDKPAWEREEKDETWRNRTGKERFDRPFDGYLDLLTWQSRRVILIPDPATEDDRPGVAGVVAMKGWQLPGFDRYERETMVGFVKYEKATKKDDPWPPLGFRSGKELWRDCHTLFQSVSERSERPKVLKWLDDLRQEGHLNRKQVQLDTFGMSANQAKIYFWRQETLPLPLEYLSDVDLLGSLRQAVNLADQVACVLSAAVWRAAVVALKPGKDATKLAQKEREAVERVVKSLGAETPFWSRLEEPFRRLMKNLPGDITHRPDQLREWYADTLEPTARAVFRTTAGEMENSSRALRASVSGEAVLNRGLARIIAEYPFLIPTHRQETSNAGT